MQTFITTLSLLAVLVNVSGNLPQLATMVRKRSSSGQSILGWSLGLLANLGLGFVNAFGYHAAMLATGNVLSVSACVGAICLVRLYRDAPAADLPPAGGSVTDLRTQEFVILHDAVMAEHHRRTHEAGRTHETGCTHDTAGTSRRRQRGARLQRRAAFQRG